ncbi:MAG: GNAT family N-acetyltransferase [Burkholderiaceae bacterium]|nr:GNAT family N-acetyltransferase [Burkholderiaceae bacterium]
MDGAPSKKVLQSFHKDAGWNRPRKEIETTLSQIQRIQWAVVELNGTNIGIARLELAPPEFCYLSELIIKNKYRGRGIGQWFVHNIEQHCARWGIPRLLLQPNNAQSTSFYEALAFSPDPYVPGFLRKDINPFQGKKRFFQSGDRACSRHMP